MDNINSRLGKSIGDVTHYSIKVGTAFPSNPRPGEVFIYIGNNEWQPIRSSPPGEDPSIRRDDNKCIVW